MDEFQQKLRSVFDTQLQSYVTSHKMEMTQLQAENKVLYMDLTRLKETSQREYERVHAMYLSEKSQNRQLTDQLSILQSCLDEQTRLYKKEVSDRKCEIHIQQIEKLLHEKDRQKSSLVEQMNRIQDEKKELDCLYRKKMEQQKREFTLYKQNMEKHLSDLNRMVSQLESTICTLRDELNEHANDSIRLNQLESELENETKKTELWRVAYFKQLKRI